ncbi:MAG: TIGR03986 family CRISPR-associated RAMP protein [Bryobacteraceae bacterium]|nr:TIGR03986 family CRISPR-associated RAMP protein [Bryobacteraceae bacterium]
MATRFYNPYHFVPAKDKVPTNLTREELAQGKSVSARHDRYSPKLHSGRIVCRIETEGPLVIGGTRTGGGRGASVAEPFELEGRPAIPASTLRGLFSSIAEASSNSALRVLEKRPLSFRKAMTEALSAIGWVKRTEAGGYILIPLTLPTMEEGKPDFARDRKGADWKPLFRDAANLKVFIGDVRSIASDPWATSSMTPDGKWRGTVYMRLQGTAPPRLQPDGTLYIDECCHERDGTVLAQKAASPLERPLKAAEVPPERSGEYTRGLIRALGTAGRDMPHTKHHELFIPLLYGTPTPLPQEVVNRFHAVCDERTSECTKGGETRLEDPRALLPYHPVGTARNEGYDLPLWDKHAQCFRLKPGDLVYFRPSKDGRGVEEIAMSAIWRGQADVDSHGFFEKIDPNLVPFHPGRNAITPAEALFGLVEDMSGVEGGGRSLGLASRVRFSPALMSSGEAEPYLVRQGQEQTLKILGQPKPPCPSLYFTSRKAEQAGTFIEKSQLSSDHHQPQGRKMYLHHRERDIESQAWKTREPHTDAQMKTCVRPVKKGTVYHFHLDFDNLTGEELGMVLYALRPTAAFRHKVGMGKGLGLGKIRVDVAGIFGIDREKRYSSAEILSSRRYHKAQATSELFDGSAKARYARELQDAEGAEPVDLAVVRAAFRKHPQAAAVLERLGDPASTARDVPVHTPTTESQPNPEKDTYKWFVANADRRNTQKQQLRPVPAQGDLPSFNR